VTTASPVAAQRPADRGATPPTREEDAPDAIPAAGCPPRERTTAILAILLTFLLTLAIFVGAFWPANDIGGSLGRGGFAGGGIGTGVGSGIGAGSGTGSGNSGTGPGGGAAGTGRGREGTTTGEAPAGELDGTNPAGTDGPAEAPAVAENVPPPWGFTRPDDPPPVIAPPVTPPPPGVPNGTAGEGVSGTSGGGGSQFMGVQSDAVDVVYIIDHSGSMDGMRLAHTKLELVRSIEQLPESGHFAVIFFDEGFDVMPPGTLVEASKKYKASAIDWVRHQQSGGGTDPTEALAYALRLRPKAIFLMTDGIFQYPTQVLQVIDRENTDRRTSINTIAFHERGAEALLQRIASENRGDYRYVPPPSP
jgi:hypothetical protein